MTNTPNSNATDAQLNQTEAPPSHLIPPETDSGMQIRGYRADRLAYVLPGGTLVVIGAFAGSFGLSTLASLLVGVGVLLLALGAYLIRTTAAHTSAIDRLRGRTSMALRQRSLPFDRSQAAGIHGVERILDDGSIEMTDGRIVQFARLHGRNTDFQTPEEEQAMISSLRRGIDSTVTEIDFSLYAMATPAAPSKITEKYKEVWLSERYDREESRDVIGYLESILESEPKASESWKATEWEHYLVVQVSPDDIDTPEIGSVGGNAVRQQQQVKAESRLASLREAFSSVTGSKPSRSLDQRMPASSPGIGRGRAIRPISTGSPMSPYRSRRTWMRGPVIGPRLNRRICRPSIRIRRWSIGLPPDSEW